MSKLDPLESLILGIKDKRRIKENRLIPTIYLLGKGDEKVLFNGEEEHKYDLTPTLGDIFQNISADQVIQVGLFHPNQATDYVMVKIACNGRHFRTCDCKESIVIGSDHAFDIHPITREAANLPLHRAGFWVN